MSKLTDFHSLLLTQSANHPLFQNRPIVFGKGKQNATILLIGEAPGAEEEKHGEPFVGKAGKNLTHFLDTIHLSREDLYITNVVKIRPYRLSEKTNKPINRPPNKQELAFFTPLLLQEIEILSPTYIVSLGNVALQAILQDKNTKIGDYHGQLIPVNQYKLFPLYHPASIIYNQSLKEVYQHDLTHLSSIIHA